MESHHIMPCGSLTYAIANTAGQEFHPAPKNFSIKLFLYILIPYALSVKKLQTFPPADFIFLH